MFSKTIFKLWGDGTDTMDSGDILRFYRSLEASLRFLIAFKFRRLFGETFEEMAEREP